MELTCSIPTDLYHLILYTLPIQTGDALFDRYAIDKISLTASISHYSVKKDVSVLKSGLLLDADGTKACVVLGPWKVLLRTTWQCRRGRQEEDEGNIARDERCELS